jgi:hypothetical protein
VVWDIDPWSEGGDAVAAFCFGAGGFDFELFVFDFIFGG